MRYSISIVLIIFIVVFYCSAIGAQHSTLIGQWTFEKGEELIDQACNFEDLVLHGSQVHDGQLHLDDHTWAHSKKYKGDTIRDKTLVAWVVIDEIPLFHSSTSGGSALTLDRISIDLFDGIVYAELEDDQWVLGSNSWKRTSSTGLNLGKQEIGNIVKIAFSQEALSPSKVINKFYLNGQLIHQYVKGAASFYPPDDTEVLFGIRHLFPAYFVFPNKWLKAKIEEARIYSGILSEAKIKSLQLVKYNQAGLNSAFKISNKISIDLLDKKLINFEYIKDWDELFTVLINPSDSIYQKLMSYKFQLEVNSFSVGEDVIEQLDDYTNQFSADSEYMNFAALVKLNYFKNSQDLNSSKKELYQHLFVKILDWSSKNHKTAYLMILYGIDAEKSLKENKLDKMIFSTEKSAEYAQQAAFYNIAIKNYGKLFDWYYFNDNYELGISISRKVKIISDEIDDYYYRIHSRNNMGACFNHLDQLDSAQYYFNEVKNLAINNMDTTWINLSDANLARISYKRGDWEAAASVLKKVIAYNVSESDYYPAAGEQIVLCKIAMEYMDEADVTPMIEKAKILVHKSGIDKHQTDWYPILSKYYFMINEPELGTYYQDRSFAVLDSLNKNSHKLLFDAMKAEKNLAFEALENEGKALSVKVQSRTNERDIIIVIMMGLFLCSIVIVRYLRKQHRVKIGEKTQLINVAERKMNQSKEELDQFKSIVHEKTEKLLALETNVKDGDAKKLEELRNQIILTDEQWKNFKSRFSDIHSSYLSNLEHNYPNLTKSEIRYLVLSKINLSTDEMASITGVSVNTIHKTHSRIRKKMNVTNEELQQIIREN